MKFNQNSGYQKLEQFDCQQYSRWIFRNVRFESSKKAGP